MEPGQRGTSSVHPLPGTHLPEFPHHSPELLLHALLCTSSPNSLLPQQPPSLRSSEFQILSAPNPSSTLNPSGPNLAALCCIAPRVLVKSLELLDDATPSTAPTAFVSPAGRVILRVGSHTVLIAGLEINNDGKIVAKKGSEPSAGRGYFWCGCMAWVFRNEGEVCKHVVAAALVMMEGALPVIHVEDEIILNMLEDEEKQNKRNGG